MSRWRLAWVSRGVINPAPAQVADLSNVTQIAAGFHFSLAIRQTAFIQLPGLRKRLRNEHLAGSAVPCPGGWRDRAGSRRGWSGRPGAGSASAAAAAAVGGGELGR